jgi:uncharacterized protein
MYTMSSDLQEYKSFYSNGQIKRREFYRDEKLEGECKCWHKNGRVKSLAFYRNGNMEGEFKSWYKNGKIMNHVVFQRGFPEGKFKQWYDNGELLICQLRRNGKSVSQYFNKGKMSRILRLKKFLLNRTDQLDTVLIADLANHVCL